MDDPKNNQDGVTRKHPQDAMLSLGQNSAHTITRSHYEESSEPILGPEVTAGPWEQIHLQRSKSQPTDLYEKYRLIALNTSDLIAFTTFDLNPVYTFVSPSHKKILGYDATDLLGKSGLELMDKAHETHGTYRTAR